MLQAKRDAVAAKLEAALKAKREREAKTFAEDQMRLDIAQAGFTAAKAFESMLPYPHRTLSDWCDLSLPCQAMYMEAAKLVMMRWAVPSSIHTLCLAEAMRLHIKSGPITKGEPGVASHPLAAPQWYDLLSEWKGFCRIVCDMMEAKYQLLTVDAVKS